jgi:hypothetical protein
MSTAVPPSVATLRDLLLRSAIVDDYQMRAALQRLEQWGGRLPRVLADLGMVKEETTAQVLASALRLPMQLLGTITRDGPALARLDARFCEENAVFPVSLNPRTHTLVLAVADPTALDVVDLVASKVNARVHVVVSTESQILAAVARHYRGDLTPAVTPPGMRARGAALPPSAGALELDLDSTPVPMRQQAASAVTRAPPSANTLLDDLMGNDEDEHGFTEEELARIDELRLTHERTTAIVRALQELLREKGLER